MKVMFGPSQRSHPSPLMQISQLKAEDPNENIPRENPISTIGKTKMRTSQNKESMIKPDANQ